MIDQRSDHTLEAEKDPELNGYEHNGEDDPDDCGDQSNPVMKQIAGCKRKNKVRSRCAKNKDFGNL